MTSPSETVEDLVAAGHAAMARADWADARLQFEAAVAAQETAELLEALSRAAWWEGDQEATFDARERAYRSYRDGGDPAGAARMAMWIASDHLDFNGDDAVSTAWLQRGHAILDGLEACAEEGYLLLLEADIAFQVHADPVTAQRKASEALALAREISDRGVEVVALALLGCALIAAGNADEGIARLEESGALAVGEDFGEAEAVGWALCHTVSACATIGDYARAEQWCRALHTWSAEWHARHFFGICRTAYGDVLATGGNWVSAEEELVSAIDDMSRTRPALAAPAAVGLGRLRVRQGKPSEARDLYESALPLPDAIVALGELALASGDATAAADAADRVLRRTDPSSVLDRFSALELAARARAAAGDIDGARAVAEEVVAAAQGLGTPYMCGRAQLVRAHVALAARAPDEGRQTAEDAADLFAACSAPFEMAEARLLLAGALAALGHSERAAAEEHAAREALALLGAADKRPPAGALTARELDILRLVAQGLGDARIAEALFLSPHTVHRHVANIRTKLGVSSRAAAVAHATKHGLV